MDITTKGIIIMDIMVGWVLPIIIPLIITAIIILRMEIMVIMAYMVGILAVE
jgi:hypothetical protein